MNDMPIHRANIIMGPTPSSIAIQGGDPIILVEMSSENSELTFYFLNEV